MHVHGLTDNNSDNSGSTIDFSRYAKQKLEVVIIGAGIAGLALAGILGRSGHKVTVLEGAPKISEVGAGIYAGPNLTRLLARWGYNQRLLSDTDGLRRINLRRWEGGEQLGAAPLMPEVEQKYGAPQYVVHRADLHKALLDAAAEVADLRVNCTVHDIDFEKPAVVLQDGSVISADVIVGADGLKSTARRLLYKRLNLVDKARPTGDAAFRALIPLDNVEDPELRSFMTDLAATRWMGPGRHVQGYPIRHGALYNLVLIHPDTQNSEESWTAHASKQEILDHFGDWDAERLGKLIKLIPDENVMKWRLCDHDPLPTWVMGKVVLMGDACHPMLPYVGQGSAQAVEDASVLTWALNQITDKTRDASVFLKVYELARKTRTQEVVDSGAITRSALHLPDGSAQRERDEKFRASSKGGSNPDLLGDPKFQAFLWQFDPEKDFLDRFEELVGKAQDRSLDESNIGPSL